MKSTVVDESLSSFKPMYCSREYQASTRLSQQYEKSTSKSSESELTTKTDLSDFLGVFLPLPAPLPFVSALCTEVVLSFSVLGATGMCGDRCADFDLILGLPALEVDAVGLSAIRHFTIYSKFCCHGK